MNEEVLVCEQKQIPQLSGTRFTRDTAILMDMLLSSRYIQRDKAESDVSFRQLIPYSILRHKNKVFVYQRHFGGAEDRLYGLMSIGIGGHINRYDALCDDSNANPLGLIERARNREIKEEFRIQTRAIPKLIGLVNDETSDFGLMHIGILYEYWAYSPIVFSREKEKHINTRFLSIGELSRDINKFELWSQIIIRDYLSNDHLPSRKLRLGKISVRRFFESWREGAVFSGFRHTRD